MSAPRPDALERLFRLSSGLLCVVADDRVSAANPAWERVLGYTPAELAALSLRSLLHPDDVEAADEADRRLRACVQPPDHDLRYRHRDGSWRWLRWDARDVLDDRRWIGSARDVTELRRATAALADAEETVRGFIDSSPDPVLIHRDGRVVFANERLARYLGYGSAAEVVGLDPLTLVHPAERVAVAGRIETVKKHGASEEPVIERLVRRDGGVVFAEVVASHVTFRGKPAMVVVTRDVTARVRMERSLRQAEEQLRLTFESAPIGMALTSVDGRWLRVNKALCDLVGYSAEELLQRRFQDITHPDDLLPDLEGMRKVLTGELSRNDVTKRYVRKDGSLVEVALRASAVRGEDGSPIHFVVQIEDVTERNRLQSQLRVRDRMSSLGVLAAGVAHEVNNPLAYVVGNLDIATEQLRAATAQPGALNAPELVRMLEEARQGAERVRKIVRDLKSFSRADEERRVPLDLRHVLETACRLCSNETRHRARLVKEFGEIPSVEADESRLVQVFINLLVNAAQAIEEGHADRNTIRLVARQDASGRAVVEVHDTGCGIPEGDVPRLFEPFFTTKKAGEGTGIGLSLCQGIVAQLGGEITVRSAVGEGTTVRVTLPASGAPPVTGGSSAAASVTLPEEGGVRGGGRGRVLVVDDERSIGAVLRRALGREHDVTVAENGREALELIAAGARYDVILCDLMMPVMSGIELHGELTAAAADQARRMIFLTGGPFTSAASNFLDRVPNERAEKPFDLQLLRALVQRVRSAG